MFRYVLTIALLVSMQPGLTAEEIRFGEGTNEFDFSFSQSAAHLDGTLRLISPYPLSDDFDVAHSTLQFEHAGHAAHEHDTHP